jgi:hypothetical protein
MISILCQMNSVHILTPISLKHILISRSYLCLGLSSYRFPTDFATKIVYVFLISPMCVAYSSHAILFGSITLIILVKSTNYEASHYTILAVVWFLPFCWVQIFSFEHFAI